MQTLAQIVETGRAVEDHRPWRRATIDTDAWHMVATALAEGRCTLLGLWGEAKAVHMALHDPGEGVFAVVSHDCPNGQFPSVGLHHAPAIRLERAAHDLFGLRARGLPDERPWLDHGAWGVSRPLGVAPRPPLEPAAYPFLPVEGDNLHQIAVGPVHAGIIEPGHFRFTASGEAVVRLEERLGYTHKGIEGLLAGADLDRAAGLAGRVSGDGTVAYQFAFARAVEAAAGIAAPARAVWLRALMAELERLANHLGDIGAICNDASFALMQAHCAILRERVLRAADAAFGHRLMRDRIVPGGVSADLTADGVAALRALLVNIGERFPELVELYDDTASLQDRTVGTGVLSLDLARRFAPGGFVGRASGRTFDARKAAPYAPYDELTFAVPTLTAGDVDARVWIRIREVDQSLSLIAQILDRLPAGPLRTELPTLSGETEGVALVEGFRGDVLAWLRLDADGRIGRCHLRDPSWFQWPLLEAVIEGNIIADFPLCNKSFNCSYSGHDL